MLQLSTNLYGQTCRCHDNFGKVTSDLSPFLNSIGFKPLRALSLSHDILLCTEQATGRLLVWKYWDAELKACFENEIQSLLDLENQDFVPRPGISCLWQNGFLLSRSYISGRTLEEAAPGLTDLSKLQFFNRLVDIVDRLHNLGRIHRDLNPKNIIVSEDHRPVLIDWDLSQSLSKQNEKSFYPKGTIGYSYGGIELELKERDHSALIQIKGFLNITGKTVKKEKTSWWAELF